MSLLPSTFTTISRLSKFRVSWPLTESTKTKETMTKRRSKTKTLKVKLTTQTTCPWKRHRRVKIVMLTKSTKRILSEPKHNSKTLANSSQNKKISLKRRTQTKR